MTFVLTGKLGVPSPGFPMQPVPLQKVAFPVAPKEADWLGCTLWQYAAVVYLDARALAVSSSQLKPYLAFPKKNSVLAACRTIVPRGLEGTEEFSERPTKSEPAIKRRVKNP
jgi:hypothetical protein